MLSGILLILLCFLAVILGGTTLVFAIFSLGEGGFGSAAISILLTISCIFLFLSCHSALTTSHCNTCGEEFRVEYASGRNIYDECSEKSVSSECKNECECNHAKVEESELNYCPACGENLEKYKTDKCQCGFNFEECPDANYCPECGTIHN